MAPAPTGRGGQLHRRHGRRAPREPGPVGASNSPRPEPNTTRTFPEWEGHMLGVGTKDISLKGP